VIVERHGLICGQSILTDKVRRQRSEGEQQARDRHLVRRDLFHRLQRTLGRSEDLYAMGTAELVPGHQLV
jgi:hypothetical protein